MLITYRKIINSDLDDIKKLCEECFPVRYPERWYKSLTTESKYYTIAAIDSEKLVGIIVGKLKYQSQCNPEDIHILSRGFFTENKLLYILTLGITTSHRKRGIGTELFRRLLSNPDFSGSVKAVYLHVLKSNDNAISFYENMGFEQAGELEDYYSIEDRLFPALTYIRFLNGGRPPRRFRDYLSQFTSYLKLMLCLLTRLLIGLVRQFVSDGGQGHRSGMVAAANTRRIGNGSSYVANAQSVVSLLSDGDRFVQHVSDNSGDCLVTNASAKSDVFQKAGLDSSPLQTDFCK